MEISSPEAPGETDARQSSRPLQDSIDLQGTMWKWVDVTKKKLYTTILYYSILHYTIHFTTLYTSLYYTILLYYYRLVRKSVSGVSTVGVCMCVCAYVRMRARAGERDMQSSMTEDVCKQCNDYVDSCGSSYLTYLPTDSNLVPTYSRAVMKVDEGLHDGSPRGRRELLG
ncbi:hypothetical protein F4810DRAFT_336052 [Camillea tinctor]|nr:hypothetical protein F4810DRAFT_336052 [Camillea tinctor]